MEIKPYLLLAQTKLIKKEIVSIKLTAFVYSYDMIFMIDLRLDGHKPK